MANKPSPLQLETILAISRIITYWKNTSDINSSTLEGDVQEELWKLKLPVLAERNISNILSELLHVIKKIDHY